MARTKQDARKSTGAGLLRKVNKPARPAKPMLLKPQDGTCLLCEAPGVVFDDLAGGVLCAVHEQERRDTSPEDSAEAIAARRKADAARAKALAAAVEAERLAAKRAAHEALLARAAAESSESEDASQPRDDVHALTRKTLRLQYALSAAPSESVMEVLRAAVSGGDTAVVDALSKVLPKARFKVFSSTPKPKETTVCARCDKAFDSAYAVVNECKPKHVIDWTKTYNLDPGRYAIDCSRCGEYFEDSEIGEDFYERDGGELKRKVERSFCFKGAHSTNLRRVKRDMRELRRANRAESRFNEAEDDSEDDGEDDDDEASDEDMS